MLAVLEIIVRLAKQHEIPVTMLIDTSHQLNDGYSTVITVYKAADSVDFALIGLLVRNDIVVTQDYGYLHLYKIRTLFDRMSVYQNIPLIAGV